MRKLRYLFHIFKGHRIRYGMVGGKDVYAALLHCGNDALPPLA